MGLLAAGLAAGQEAGVEEQAARKGEEGKQEEQPLLKPYGPDYRTPLAGESFRTRFAGRDVVVLPRERRSVTAWDAGMVVNTPGAKPLPVASLYLWRRPDPDLFLRAVLVGVYNDVYFSKAIRPSRPLEGVLTFENNTVPVPDEEMVDGRHIEEEEVYWGSVRGGAGLGYRKNLAHPGQTDNMLAVSFLMEPGYLYFEESSDAADDFVEPRDTWEGRGRLKLRMDALLRNLLELPHRGFALGGDLVYGRRIRWEDWGRGGSEDASAARDYLAFSGYLAGAGGVPFLENNERHRLIGTLHGGTGSGLDRFSAFRLGGGPTGEEYEALSRPIIPGAALLEFTTSDYLVAVGEYRFEALFFVYLSARSSISYLKRRRIEGSRFTESDDVLASLGGRITTGFVFKTRLQLDYNYNFDVVRRDDHGAHEVTFHLGKEF